jgi:hypothetical protein
MTTHLGGNRHHVRSNLEKSVKQSANKRGFAKVLVQTLWGKPLYKLTRSLSLPRKRPTQVASASSTAKKNLARSSSGIRDVDDAAGTAADGARSFERRRGGDGEVELDDEVDCAAASAGTFLKADFETAEVALRFSREEEEAADIRCATIAARCMRGSGLATPPRLGS